MKKCMIIRESVKTAKIKAPAIAGAQTVDKVLKVLDFQDFRHFF